MATAVLLEQEPILGAATARLRPLDHETLNRMEAGLAASVLPACVDTQAAAVRLRAAGRTIVALPIDTRRFVRAMARHLCMN